MLMGVFIGCPAAWVISRLLTTALPGVSSKIVGGMLFSSLILLLAGCVAALVPALRASRIDSASALRNL